MSDNVIVYRDGIIIAHSKNEWEKQFIPKLRAKGVLFKIESAYGLASRFTFVEYFNSAASWSGTRSECCWGNDITTYVLEDGKVSKIYITRVGEKIKI